MNSKNILESPVTGCEEFLGEFLQPRSENISLEESIHDYLVEYYNYFRSKGILIAASLPAIVT
jgi:hypothetical protein